MVLPKLSSIRSKRDIGTSIAERVTLVVLTGLLVWWGANPSALILLVQSAVAGLP